MHRYKVTAQLGEGCFTSIVKATHLDSGDTVAIKTLKSTFDSWESALALPEVQCLRKTNGHLSVIKLREVIREKSRLYLIFEYCECK